MPDLIPSRFRPVASAGATVAVPSRSTTAGAGCGCTAGAGVVGGAHAGTHGPAGGPEPTDSTPRTMGGIGALTLDGLPAEWTVALHPWPEGATQPESAIALDPRVSKVPAGHYVVRVLGPTGEAREWETTVEPDRETRLDFASARVTREADLPGPGTGHTPNPELPPNPSPPTTRTMAQVIVTGAPAGTNLVLRSALREMTGGIPRHDTASSVQNLAEVPFRLSGGFLVADAPDTGRWVIVDPLVRPDGGEYVFHPVSLDAGTRTEVPWSGLLRTPAGARLPPGQRDPLEIDGPGGQRPPPSGTDKVLVGITLAAVAVTGWALFARPDAAPRQNPSRTRGARRNARSARHRGR